MTNEEKIKALKENTSAFGLMDKELQDKARDIGKRNFFYYSDDWVRTSDNIFCGPGTYRLRPNYAEEPEVVDGIENVIVHKTNGYRESMSFCAEVNDLLIHLANTRK